MMWNEVAEAITVLGTEMRVLPPIPSANESREFFR